MQSLPRVGLMVGPGGTRFSCRTQFSFATAPRTDKRRPSQELNRLIEEKGKQKPHPLTIKHLMDTAKESKRNPNALLLSGQFLQNELPVRLAHRLKDMQNLPYIVGMNPYVRSVYALYCNSFEELSKFPRIETLEQEQEYTRILKRLVEDHRDVIPILSKGMMECKKYISNATVKSFLDAKIRDRIGIRVLAEQHIALHSENPEGYAGIINTRLNPTTLIQNVCKAAQELCTLNYGICPELEITGAVDAVFPYIPVHMEYIVFELMKNAMRATVEWCESNREDLHPLRVTIGKGPHDITIRFSDRGGGVPYEELESIWEYSYSTMHHGRKIKKQGQDGLPLGSVRGEDQSIFAAQAAQDMQAGVGGPMAGLGYGLPMSRVYAEFFGGNLDLVSMYGRGCDVFLRLNHLEDQMETAPI